jgi:hypothetical protein
MASDYEAIRRDNQRRYGTDIGRIGPMLLADRYDDRTHFIFELLQNAEDALARRTSWEGARSIKFNLSASSLRVSHFGHPFDEADVRGICGIAESTKGLTAIGRFGIGFKSVYAFTDRPEIHSGIEDFGIESFVWPVAVPPLVRAADETVILIPLKTSDLTGREDIAAGLERLGATALLFLRQVQEIQWSVDDGRSGLYLRQSQDIDGWVRRVSVIGHEQHAAEVDEEWLVFSRSASVDDERNVGYVEIAFLLGRDEQSQRERILRIERSPLVVFFPTVLETHLGFLVQGPYRTTPSRDNVPRNEPWNQRLVADTASLLIDALRWLRDHDFVDTTALRCLPLDSTKFGETSMFAPIFRTTKEALSREQLLPRFDIGHVSAARARLARTQELRQLFAPSQLATLFGDKQELYWLSGEITQDRAPEVRRYLMQELGVAELTPETTVPRLDKPFLRAQSDEWILNLYEFLHGQPALKRRVEDLPLVRLDDGSHVCPRVNGQPQAFLPGLIATAFPTVRATVCTSDSARDFLRSIGLTEPDPVDDVVRNVLPRYREGVVAVSDVEYEADIDRILRAFATDSKVRRDKLLDAMQQTAFVKAVDAGDGGKLVLKASDVYLATERLKELFGGVRNVSLVDDTYTCLRGEDVRELLEACGATRYLQPVSVGVVLPPEQRSEIRRNAGLQRASWERPIVDTTVRGLRGVLELLPSLGVPDRRRRAEVLWEALVDLESRRGSRAFLSEYTWGYFHETRAASFDAAFVRELNATAWVPDADGELQRPEFVLFDAVGWKPNPLLQSKIRFKPPIIETLAREAGIDPGVLDLLKKLGVTSAAQLRERLQLKDMAPGPSDESPADVEDAIKQLLGNAPPPTPPVPDPTNSDRSRPGGEGAGGSRSLGDRPDRGETGSASQRRDSAGTGSGTEGRDGSRVAGGDASRPFISYVATHHDDEGPDPDGLDHEARMVLERQAIDLIRSREPQWQPTPTHNPGYDLFETGTDGSAIRWCEVKAMAGALQDRPVGLSHTQFQCAQDHGEAYWLYIVEHAGTQRARLVRIQNPAGKTRTFTFDHGWLVVAALDVEQGDQGH